MGIAPILFITSGLIIVILTIILFIKHYRYEDLYYKYKDIIDLDKHKSKLRAEISQFVAEKNIVIQNKDNEIRELSAEYAQKRQIYDALVKEIELYDEHSQIISFGLYKPHYDYDTSEKYKISLEAIREKEKELIKIEQAAICNTSWMVNGNRAEGRKQTKHYMKLMLRAFNGESDALIADVRWNNIQRMEERLRKSYDLINKLGETHETYLNETYYDLKLQELRLTFEYADKIQQEREEQRRIQDQIREEEKARKEIERALRDSEENEKRYSQALEQARKEMEQAKGKELSLLTQKIDNLSKQLEEAQKLRQRALSMAQQTKAGHVYIISNIGSFGMNVFKIGMTRRLEPKDRIRELGDASVPFNFDIHAIIYSENAPQLETLLQKSLDHKKINLVNNRREFFSVTIDEIESIIRKHDATIELTKVAEAREFKESQLIRKSWQSSTHKPEATPAIERFPVSL
jgi:hypothetical protein